MIQGCALGGLQGQHSNARAGVRGGGPLNATPSGGLSSLGRAEIREICETQQDAGVHVNMETQPYHVIFSA